jgi:hypothetical protein
MEKAGLKELTSRKVLGGEEKERYARCNLLL